MAESSETPESSLPFDTFYSPHNEEFYKRSPYEPLAKASRELRLIRLFPGQREDPIICELVDNLTLESVRSKYLAISYYAGDPNDTVPIAVNGMRFNVFATLGTAIRHVRLAELDVGDQKQLLWTDQICINQSDFPERAHQVGFMKDIYEGADRVLVWLGGESGDGRALRFLRQQYHRVAGVVDGVNAARPEAARDPPGEAWRYASEAIAQEMADHTRDENFVESWTSVRELIHSPWWSRCWVAQELIVAREAVVIFGPKAMFWHEFREAFTVVDKVIRAIFLTANPGDIYPRGDEVRRLRSLIGALDVSHIMFMIERQKEWEKAASTKELLPLLRHSRSCKSSDPRDRVYAFLGLADPRYDIVPIYDPTINTIEDTLYHTAKRIILHDRRLDILSLAQESGCQETGNLPSWVPDWRVPSERSCPLDDGYHAAGDYPAVALFPARPDGVESRVLRAACLIVDQLAESPDAMVTQHDDGTVSSTLHKWLPIAGLDLDHPTGEEQTYPHTGQDLIDAVLSVIYLGKDWSSFLEGRGEDGAETWAKSQDDAETWARRRQRDINERWRTLILETACSGDWVFFRSPKDFIGIADCRARHTDCIAIVLGASVPYILRKEGGHYKLIGEAYVHGIMDGEAIGMMSRGEIKVEMIDIV